MRKIPLLLVGALALSACSRQVIVSGAQVGPSLVVEQFLRAANAKDLETMARLFGTKDGPVWSKYPRAEVEQRMFAIAAELRHQDFEIASEQMVPGRINEAKQLNVRLTMEERGKVNVPFTVVRYKSDSWLIEQIGLEALTSPRN